MRFLRGSITLGLFVFSIPCLGEGATCIYLYDPFCTPTPAPVKQISSAASIKNPVPVDLTGGLDVYERVPNLGTVPTPLGDVLQFWPGMSPATVLSPGELGIRGPLTLAFSSPIVDIGLNVRTLFGIVADDPALAYLQAYDIDGNLLNSYASTVLDPFVSESFLGLSSSVPIYGVQLSSTNIGGWYNTDNWFAVSDLILGGLADPPETDISKYVAKTITFDPLQGDNGAEYFGHDEEEFSVNVVQGAFHEGQYFGNPAASLFGKAQSELSVLHVTHSANRLFGFDSVDLASNGTGDSGFELIGMLNDEELFRFATQLDSPSIFSTITNPQPHLIIDELFISVASNSALSFNIDNIRLLIDEELAANVSTQMNVQPVPEPNGAVLLGSGIVVLTVVRRLRRKRTARSS